VSRVTFPDPGEGWTFFGGTGDALAMSDAETLTHLDARGAVRMVDVGEKPVTLRRAVAEARVRMSPETVALARAGEGPKGNVEATVRIAAVMAAKRTPELIPLCHGLQLTAVHVDIAWDDAGATLRVTAEARDRTGVEMEAMTGASVGALALYDMVKGVERGVVIEAVALLEKSGGRSGHWTREGDP
jgi:cyclic pyranopterin phosphate synthase